jgi:hypothetical protein
MANMFPHFLTTAEQSIALQAAYKQQGVFATFMWH